VNTDESQLRSCLINLVGNAIKFTESGQVTLRVQSLHNQEPTTNNKQQIKIIFEVEDTGPGIAQEEVDLLFEPFRQTQVGRNSQH
jgi:signal transduction histidine kinase